MPRFYIKPIAALLLLPWLLVALSPLALKTFLHYMQIKQAEAGEIQVEPSPYWQESSQAILLSIAKPERTFGYYQVKNWENAAIVAERFGVNETALKELNQRTDIVSGVTIKIPPLTERLPLTSHPATPLSDFAVIHENNEVIIETSSKNIVPLSLVEIAEKINDPNILEKTGDKEWLLKKTLKINRNIRFALTKDTVNRFSLLSTPQTTICLCLEGGQLVTDEVAIQSWDNQRHETDKNSVDKRSYILARKGSRMDIINSEISFLGYHMPESSDETGGTYGISWRIPNSKYGVDYITGWVENSMFHDNYFGAYTYGTTGMVFLKNEFFNNAVYGLNLDDDSTSFLIQENKAHHNGSHGIILSDRCQGNLLRQNNSFDNKGHGIMLYNEVNHNQLQGNTFYHNKENVVVYKSAYNTIVENTAYAPHKSNIRISHGSTYNRIANNTLLDKIGIKAYKDSTSNLFDHNSITAPRALTVDSSSRDNVVHDNRYKKKGKALFDNPKNIIVGPNVFET